MMGFLCSVDKRGVCSFLCFFFFKHKTAYEMRISDWSSDVCSSDLPELQKHGETEQEREHAAAQESWRIEVEQAEQVQNVQRIRRRQILDPTDERLVPHLDGQRQHLIECEEKRNLKEHGQTASQRIDLLLSIKPHHILLKQGLIVFEFFFKSLHFCTY